MKIRQWAITAFVVLGGCNIQSFGQNAKQIADQGKGNHLYHACKAAIRNADSNETSLSPTELMDITGCESYIDGFVTGSSLQSIADRHLFCLDESVSLGVIIRLYVLYMEKHPKLLDAIKAEGLVRTLEANYPCSKSDQK